MKSILDSPIISKYISQEKIEAYEADLDIWLDQYDSNQHLGPKDHFAVKVENAEELNKLIEAIKPYCIDNLGKTPGLSVRKMHGRKIAVALLKEPLKVRSDEISCIEIMQPRPESEGSDIVGLDHLELINPHHDVIIKTLKDKNADYYIDETNPYKKIVVAFINDRKERIKFTDKTLAEIVPIQIQDEPERVEIISPLTIP